MNDISLIIFYHSIVGKIRDKKVGKIGRKIAEKSFFGGPRKEKRMEISSARKIGGKSDLSAIYRFFTDISRLFLLGQKNQNSVTTQF